MEDLIKQEVELNEKLKEAIKYKGYEAQFKDVCKELKINHINL
jgi:uncharacterized protein YaiL (DUF2058 family)